jgi:2-oxoglutarate dehydrogenase E2 component (dihydrolipoamide succinyltransferase)
MATEVKLPDVLQGVQDVTINRWLVKAGDTVKAGQPILEVATEKVDTQVDSPADGAILQIFFGEGEIVTIDSSLALIGRPDEIQGGQVQGLAPARAPEEQRATEAQPGAQPAPALLAASDAGHEATKATPVARRVAEEQGIAIEHVKGSGAGSQVTKEDVLAYVAGSPGGAPGEGPVAVPVSAEGPAAAPAGPEAGAEGAGAAAGVAQEAVALPVQRLAAEHNINLRELAGDRPWGSLTPADILAAVASRTGQAAPPPRWEPRWLPAAVPQPAAPVQVPLPPAATLPKTPQAPVAGQAPAAAGKGEELVPHSRMRTLIARNTVQSAFTIPQVTTWWDVDMTAVLEHRRANKASFAAEGANLTITAYLVQAAIAGLRAVPSANSSWSDEGVLIKHYYNIGVAVALPRDDHGLGGLLVPVIKSAGDLSLLGLARAVNDLAQRARNNQLTGADLLGGTFSVSNYGTSGSRFQTPIITGNQAGILGVGAIERRPVLTSRGGPLEARLDDQVAFLPMLTLGFTYDHRILDGATADAYCAAVKDALEKYR